MLVERSSAQASHYSPPLCCPELEATFLQHRDTCTSVWGLLHWASHHLQELAFLRFSYGWMSIWKGLPVEIQESVESFCSVTSFPICRVKHICTRSLADGRRLLCQSLAAFHPAWPFPIVCLVLLQLRSPDSSCFLVVLRSMLRTPTRVSGVR